MSKKKDERQFKIRQLIMDKQKVKITDLSRILNVTPETIRKDLLQLENTKIIKRQHGFAIWLQEPNEMPVSLRNQEYIDEKQQIMKKACTYIKEGMMVYLDAGSTCQAGIHMLSTIPNITIVTNSIFVAYKCSLLNMKIILIGGNISNSAYRSYGSLATETIDYIHIDVAILGSKGFEKSTGFTSYENEYILKRHVMQQSECLIVVADKHKFHKAAEYPYCKFKEIDIFITSQIEDKELQIVKEIPNIIKVAEE